MKYPSRTSRGFTLVELLVAIAIVGILAALLVSAVGGARNKANVVRSINNMKQIYTAHQSYLADNGAFPSANEQPMSPSISKDFPAKYWEERLVVYLGLGSTIEEGLTKFVAGKEPPAIFTVPGRRKLQSNGGDTTEGYRSIYSRNGKIFANTGEIASGNSFLNLLPFQKLASTFFLIDTRGDPVRANDFNGWQIDAASRLKWPAHGGKTGTLNGTVAVCFMDGHAEARSKKDIPINWQDPFWLPPTQ